MSLPAGRRTKWIVLTGWLVVLVIGDPPAGPQLAAALREVPGRDGGHPAEGRAGPRCQACLEGALAAPPDSRAASATIEPGAGRPCTPFPAPTPRSAAPVPAGTQSSPARPGHRPGTRPVTLCELPARPARPG